VSFVGIGPLLGQAACAAGGWVLPPDGPDGSAASQTRARTAATPRMGPLPGPGNGLLRRGIGVAEHSPLLSLTANQGQYQQPRAGAGATSRRGGRRGKTP